MSFLSFLTGSAGAIAATILASVFGLSIRDHSLKPLETLILSSLLFGSVIGFGGTVIGTFFGALASRTAKYAKIFGACFFAIGAAAAPTFFLLLDMKMKGVFDEAIIVFFTPWMSLTCGIAAGHMFNEDRDNLNKISMAIGVVFTLSVIVIGVRLAIK